MTAESVHGEQLARHFRVGQSPSLVATSLRKSRFAVTRLRFDGAEHGMTTPIPPQESFNILLQFRDIERHELFLRGRSVHAGRYPAGSVSIVALEDEPTAYLGSPFDTLHFYVPRAALDEIAEDAHAPRIDTLRWPRATHDPTAWHLGSALLPALSHPETTSRIFVESVMLALHTHFAQAYGGMRVGAAVLRGGLAPGQLRRALEMMQARLDQDITLSDLAAECGLSLGHFTRAFRKSTGQSPHRRLLELRTDRARQALSATTLPLAEIASLCGFADQSHFNRVFRRLVGATPGAWRRAVRD